MKAVLQYRASPGFRERLAEREPDWLAISVVDETDTDRFQAEMRDAQVLLHVLEPVTAAVIAAAPELRLIQKIGVGVDTIDLEAAGARGIAVANMPGTNSQAVAEQALMLMLATLRKLTVLDRATREGRGWLFEPETFDRVGELCGRVVGLVGYGRVARLLAPMLRAIGAKVLVNSRERVVEPDVEWRELDDLLREADIVSLHAPLTEETRSMLDAAAVAAMKPGAVLINTARGGLVDEAALVDGLRSGHLRGAGLDVFAVEPVESGSELLRLDTVFITPHVAWLTPETLDRSVAVAIENCRRLRDGEDFLNRVA